MQDTWYGDYLISTDKSRLDLDTVCQFLSRSYWARTRSAETISQSIAQSVCYGVYHGSDQIGFARVVTDHSTVYYLCDVFIDERYRGKSIGKTLVEAIVEDFRDLMGMLVSTYAQDLYSRYGFVRVPERFMERKPGPFSKQR